MINYLINQLGLFLLYMPPLFMFILKDSLKRVEDLTSIYYTMPIGFSLTYFLSLMVPEATYVFIFYFLLFHFLIFYTRGISKYVLRNTYLLSKIDSFAISIYFCFAISVLWEWPYQIAFHIPYGIYQDAMLASLFKALGIIFFFYTVYKIGWRPNVDWLMIFLATMMAGLLLAFTGIYFSDSAEPLFWFYQAYRLPWILLFLIAIPRKTYKDNNVKE